MIDKTYKRAFEFGKVAADGSGARRNLVVLEVELEIKDNKPRFTASGEIWNHIHTDIIEGGQCIDSIWAEHKQYLINRWQYCQIMRLWELYHLNDMHADCIHQRREKWSEPELQLAYLKLDSDMSSQQSMIEREAMREVKTMGRVQITPEARAILNMPYFLTVPAEDVEKYPDYKVDRTEKKRAGWVRPEEHPRGVLGKPCPVCGYKYGTAWVYESIPSDDLREILELLEVDYQERAQIMKLGGPAHE